MILQTLVNSNIERNLEIMNGNDLSIAVKFLTSQLVIEAEKQQSGTSISGGFDPHRKFKHLL